MQIMVQTYAQNITTDTTLANKHFETAEEYYNNKTYDTAATYFEKSAVLYKQHDLWGYYFASERRRAMSVNKYQNIDTAIIIIKTALNSTLKHIDENDINIARAYNSLGYRYSIKSENDIALEYYFKSLKVFKELFGEKHKDVALNYMNIGVTYSDKAEYDKALEYAFKSIEIYIELLGETHIRVANLYNNIGLVYKKKSEYNKALEYHFLALEIMKKLYGEKHAEIAMTYNNIGVVYKNKAENDKALEYHLKALEIRKELLGENHSYVAMSYNNIGIVYKNKGEFDLALEYHFKALEVRKGLAKQEHNKAKSYNNIGIVYKNKGEYDKALEYLNKAIEIKTTLLGHKHLSVASSYIGIGQVYFKKKEYDTALECCFKSLEIYKEILGKKHASVANSYNSIGIIYKNKLEYNKALFYCQQAIVANFRDYNDTTDITKIPVMKNYINYIDILDGLQTKAEIFSGDFQISDTLKTSDKYKIALKHYQAADTLISQVRKNISTKSDKLALGETASEIYKGAVNVCIDLSGFENLSNLNYKEQAFYFSEKNKSSVLLEALAGSEALEYAGIPDTLLQTEHKLSIDIANYKNLKNNEDNDSIANVWAGRLFNANRSYDSLITVFETNYPEYYNLKYNNSPATVEQVANLMDKKTAMLSYFIGDSTITIFAISGKKSSQKLKEERFVVCQVTKPDSLDEWISNYRFVLSETDLFAEEIFDGTHYSVDEYKELAFKLHNLLFPLEIKEFLKGGLFYNIENLIIIPDGQLATLPFESLLTEKYNAEWTDWKNKVYFAEMPYLIKDYAVSYSYSATLFQQTFSKEKTTSPEFSELDDWLALAPVFDGVNSSSRLRDGNSVGSLPGTEMEVKTISNLFEKQNRKTKINLFNDANEAYVKSEELQNYKILHFATHGFVNTEKPELSGIILAQDTTIAFESYENIYGNIAQQNDGILYQSEIYNLELNADLIVLSACETGLGKIASGEGVIGLTRALLYAGTDNIVVSLWSVSDASTAELMIDFYKNILNKKPTRFQKPCGFNKPLREAKLKMIEEGKYAHPYFWSPFILIGE